MWISRPFPSEYHLQKTGTNYSPAQYWNWGDYVEDLTHSAVFDGSQYSMSGDGAPLAHTPIALGFGSNATVGEGNGGGCLMSGPFKEYEMLAAYLSLFL
jgi:tyrosinase